jgi:hypothetical protein
LEAIAPGDSRRKLEKNGLWVDGRMKIVAALLTLLSLSTFIAGFAAAISNGDQFFSLLEEDEYPPKVPVGPALVEMGLILAGTGVASNSTADLPLTLMVERAKVIRPPHAKKLFDDLDRIDAFRTQGSMADDGSDYSGHMLLFERPYLLGQIEITGGEDVSDLEAKVLKTTASGEEVVGHLSIKTERRDRVWDGEGILSMEDGIIRGDYEVVLEMTPQAERRTEEPQIAAGPPPDISRIVSAGSAP